MQLICQDKVFNVPNVLTLIRIALLPVVAWYFKMGHMALALAVYLIAMVTDVFDGLIARKFNQITAMGKLLDPIADKLSVITMLWLFVSVRQIPLWVLIVFLLKELIMISGSGAALKCGIVVCAQPIGKATTLVFVFSVVARFVRLTLAADMLLYLCVALSLLAVFWYAKELAERLGNKNSVQSVQ